MQTRLSQILNQKLAALVDSIAHTQPLIDERTKRYANNEEVASREVQRQPYDENNPSE